MLHQKQTALGFLTGRLLATLPLQRASRPFQTSCLPFLELLVSKVVTGYGNLILILDRVLLDRLRDARSQQVSSCHAHLPVWCYSRVPDHRLRGLLLLRFIRLVTGSQFSRCPYQDHQLRLCHTGSSRNNDHRHTRKTQLIRKTGASLTIFLRS